MKKLLKVLVLTVALAALVCGLLIGCDKQDETAVSDEYKIGWNTDGTAYYNVNEAVTNRMRSGEYYRARFAVDGEQIDLFFTDVAAMTVADKYTFVALKYDENNVVTECRPVTDVTGGLGAWNYHIESVTDTEIVCNYAGNFKGSPATIRINENTKTYNVGGTGLLVGLPGVAEPGGRVYAVLGHDGYASHLFVTGAFVASPVYWNVTRMYDSTAKMSTRERDALGYFVFDMVADGQAVQLKTMDADVAAQVDAFGAKCMHLTFNEDGTIQEAKHARYATGGNSAASWYHVTEYIAIENKFSAEKFSGSDKGNSGTFTLANSCKIYDMSGRGAYVGVETDLRVGDQVHGLTNPAGEVVVLFIVSRNADVDLYYNMERMWNANAKKSTRRADANGWYHFEFSVNGEKVKLKTKDPDVVYTIDERAACVLGLEVDGDVITAAYKPSGVNGRNNTIFDYTVVTKVEGDRITSTRNGKTYEGTMSASCEVYNVSSSAAVKGQKDTVQVGDTVYGLAGVDKKVNEIYITKRVRYSHLYWNLDRNYDTTNKVSKRAPDADGYYYIRLLDDGELVTFKTNKKSIVDELDSYVAVGLDYSKGEIIDVYKYDQINGIKGGFASWKIVTSISGNTIACDTTQGTMSSRVKVYNVSKSAITPGELTDVRVGDRIHGITDTRGKIMYIFVVNRAIQSDLYYNVDRKWADGASTRTPDADGFYHFVMAVNGKQVNLKTDNASFVESIDGRAAKVLGLALDGDVIKAVYLPSDVQGSETTKFDYSVVTEIAADGTITTTRNGNTYVGKPGENCKIFNVSTSAEIIGEVTQVEVDDTLYGFANSKGEVTTIFVVSRVPKLKTKTDYCKACDAEVEWNEWKGDAVSEGHYYLTDDVELKSAILVDKKKTVCFDLCGYDITGVSTLDRMINIYGVFNLFDEKKSDGTFDGYISTTYNNTSSSRVGNIFYIQNEAGAEFNMYGGNLTSTGTNQKGKIGGITRTFNIYDGTISGGKATGYGGALRIEAGTGVINIKGGILTAGSGTVANGGGVIYMNSGAVNMTGGKIIGGTVSTNGGAVCVDGTNAVFTLSGGTIVGGTTTNGGAVQVAKGTFQWTGGTITAGSATYGNTIHANGTSSKIVLANTVTIGGVYLAKGAQIDATKLNAASSVGIIVEQTGVFATCASASAANNLKGCFKPENSDSVYVDGAKLTTENVGSEEPENKHSHCVCGGNTKNVGDHTTCTQVDWEPWTGTWESGKYYYLTEDYTCNATIAITKNQVLNLCLNGKKFNGASSVDRIFNVYGTVNICDHKVNGEYSGKVIANKTNTASSAKTGAVFYTQNSSSGYGVFNLYGGTLTATGKVYRGGICGLGNAMNMYDGVITGGKVADQGGNIYMESNGYSTFNMYGGTVSNGQADNLGGNIRAGNKLVITGGNLFGGTAGTGADIYLNRSAGTITLSGLIGTNNLVIDVYIKAGNIVTTALDSSVKINITKE